MRVHFIAVGGSAMHNLAIALKKKGYQVSGSDDVIFEPSKSRLAKYGILPEQQGWDPARIDKDIDAVILGMHAREDNPELLEAQKLGLKIYSYPEYIYEQSKDKLRIVIGGSHGKTTITSMILHVLNYYGRNFDYLVGAQLEGFETMVKITQDAPIIVIEGDEYLASPIDRRPKFHLYQANVAVLSGIAWDHINVFPTFDNYLEQFQVFLQTIKPGGTIIYCEDDPVLKDMVCHSDLELHKKPYSVPSYKIDKGVTKLLNFGQETPLRIFGTHNLLNLNAAWLVLQELGFSYEEFLNAIKTFKGAARRLELLGKNDDTAIYKDFAHSPSKLKATIQAVKNQFPDRELVAVIELHTFSSLNKNFLEEYAGTMEEADDAIVFIDKTIFLQKRLEPYEESFVKKAFADENVKFFNNVEILERFLSYLNYKGKNLLLMSSGNFGGMDLKKLAELALNSNK
ncbi:MAG TPA: Mur ligase family protein [Daejeonella sp.]|nr:Mur ligase family protein [Daejeonella sp.]